jgi:WD40 repeat protein
VDDENWGSDWQTLRGHSDKVFSIAFSPISKLLASACCDGTTKLWDVLTGELKHTLEDFVVVESLVFSPDGQLLASGSSSHITLWDPVTGEPNRTLEDDSYDEDFSVILSNLGSKLENFSAQDWHESALSDPAKPMNKPALRDDRWVTIRGQREVWLPPDYTPICSTATDGAIGIWLRKWKRLRY